MFFVLLFALYFLCGWAAIPDFLYTRFFFFFSFKFFEKKCWWGLSMVEQGQSEPAPTNAPIVDGWCTDRILFPILVPSQVDSFFFALSHLDQPWSQFFLQLYFLPAPFAVSFPWSLFFFRNFIFSPSQIFFPDLCFFPELYFSPQAPPGVFFFFLNFSHWPTYSPHHCPPPTYSPIYLIKSRLLLISLLTYKFKMCYSHLHPPTHPSTFLPTNTLNRYLPNPTYMVTITCMVAIPMNPQWPIMMRIE